MVKYEDKKNKELLENRLKLKEILKFGEKSMNLGSILIIFK